ncbi:hypothetical protein AB6F55_13375 [Providencia hangzhouensis]
MKKVSTGVSITINVILAIALITTIMMFFNIKSKINTMVEQIKSGEYIELVKQNSQQLLPDSLKELSTIEITDNPCGYFTKKLTVQ